ncbi:hypothetical protein [Spiroplasma endosymbiont of Polydrusus formosus]
MLIIINKKLSAHLMPIVKFMGLIKLKLFKLERYYLIAKKNSPNYD